MTFKEWSLSQFEVRTIAEGKQKGRVCFRTPCFDYTMEPELWKEIKEKLMKG